MFPSRVLNSKASRLPMIPKQGNKDYYKGTRAAYLPGAHRTGAPGKHVVGGKAKYRIIDEKVRYYVAPPIRDIESSPLKPYVYAEVRWTQDDKLALFGKLPRGGFDGSHYLKLAAAEVDFQETQSVTEADSSRKS